MRPPFCALPALATFAPLLVTSIPPVSSREIVFPPISPIQALGQQPLSNPDPSTYSNHDNDDGSIRYQPLDALDPGSFTGLTTYANLPWVPCFSHHPNTQPTTPEGQKYDIAILGAPFDTATTFRPGARFGPTGIRLGSRRISAAFSWSAYTHRNPFAEGYHVVDCGDAPLTFLDNTVALKQLVSAHRAVTAPGRARNVSVSSVPRVITLGGDHTTTLAALRGTVGHWGPVAVVHFDSHLDTWDPDVLGGGLSGYAGVNHGTFLHVAHEEGLVSNGSNLHVGIRAPASNRKYDWKHDRGCGFEIVTARDIDRVGIKGVIQRIRERVGEELNVYITVDIDVLDPAHAPGTGTAEVGGWTTRELLSVLDGLEGLKVIGADVVEVAPAYDNVGETTVLAAAEVVRSLITLMVATPVKPLEDLS